MALHEDLAIIDLTARVHLAGAISLVFLEVIRRPVHLGVTKSLVRLVAIKRQLLPGEKSAQVRLAAKRRLGHLGATKSLDRLTATKNLVLPGETRSLEAKRVLLGMKTKALNLERLPRKRAVAKVDNKQLFYN